ncbi:MAG: hypothetical protein ACT4PW_03635 [Acidimicrobiia bacterium]
MSRRLRTWAVRRALGRVGVEPATVRHLTTFQRLGATFEVQSPGAWLPIGARIALRALRSRSALHLCDGWVLPHWLDRQSDPTSPAFVPRGHLPFLTNLTARNWTMVGNLASPWEAVVDPRGLVCPWDDAWSLDWWVGAEDRWHIPSREVPARMRQRLVGASPVVETAMRIPGGEAVHRTYAVAGTTELTIVEVENRSPVPVALALAVRPYNVEGFAVVTDIGLGPGHTVTVDGQPALLLPRAPAGVAMSTLGGGDVAAMVTAAKTAARLGDEVHDDAGMATAAFVYPLPHGATLRVAVPAPPAAPRLGRRGPASTATAPRLPATVPSAEAVARGWAAQTRHGLRLALPDDRLQEAVDANLRFLLLLHNGPDITAGPATYHRFYFRDAAFMLAALGRYGRHDEVAEVLAGFSDRQQGDGYFLSQGKEWDANGCALWAIADHWRLTGDTAVLQPLAETIARAARWIDRARRDRPGRRAGRGEGRDPSRAGLLPPGLSAEHLGPYDQYYWDDWWGVAGLRAAADLLDAVDQSSAARDAATAAGALYSAVRASLAVVQARLGTAALPAGPGRRLDAAMISSLVACEPLGLLGPDDPAVRATLDILRDRHCQGAAFFQPISHSGLGTYLTMHLAQVELAGGDRRCLDRLDWLLDAATPTWSWPEAVHPVLGTGCMGDGHHGWAAAAFLSFVRDLLVREQAGPDAGLALCPMLPAAWLGCDLAVHDAPTRHGRLSFALRWHGARPALLWELEPGPGAGGPVRLCAPGLDPSWSSTEPRGEALLGAVEPAGGLPKVYGTVPPPGAAAGDVGGSYR